MKPIYPLLAFLFAGTVVSAHMIAPAPGATALPAVAGGQRALPPTITARDPSAASYTVHTISSVKPPVPLVLSGRTASNAKAGAEEVVAAREPSPSGEPIASQPGVKAEAAAKATVEQDGYKGVRGLTKGSDGVWRGHAMRGMTEVAISVDADGSVSAQ